MTAQPCPSTIVSVCVTLDRYNISVDLSPAQVVERIRLGQRFQHIMMTFKDAMTPQRVERVAGNVVYVGKDRRQE